MKARDYRKMSKKELIDTKKQLEMSISSSYGKVGKKEKPQNRSRNRREIAKINTILNEK